MRIRTVAFAWILTMTASIGATAAPIQFSQNDHWYEFVPGGMTWTDARQAAETRIHHGEPGYLATITSAAEQAFVESILDGHLCPGFEARGDVSHWDRPPQTQ